MRRLRKFISLDPPHRILLIKAWVLLWTVKAGLLLLRFNNVHRLLLQRARKHPEKRGKDSEFVERVTWSITQASRYVVGARNCLVQALVAQFLLQRCGIEAHLKLGVVRDEDKGIQAHAWVECQGKVVIGETGRDRFSPLNPPEEIDF